MLAHLHRGQPPLHRGRSQRDAGVCPRCATHLPLPPPLHTLRSPDPAPPHSHPAPADATQAVDLCRLEGGSRRLVRRVQTKEAWLLDEERAFRAAVAPGDKYFSCGARCCLRTLRCPRCRATVVQLWSRREPRCRRAFSPTPCIGQRAPAQATRALRAGSILAA